MEKIILKEKYEIEKNNVKDKDEITIIYKNKKLDNVKEELIKEVKNYTGEEMSKNKLFGEIFVRNNKNNCKIVINGKEKELVSFYDIEKLEENGMLEIKLKGINNIKNMSFMFCGCLSLLSLPDISKWNIYNVTNIGYIFCGCLSLTELADISKWNIINVTNMSTRYFKMEYN